MVHEYIVEGVGYSSDIARICARDVGDGVMADDKAESGRRLENQR